MRGLKLYYLYLRINFLRALEYRSDFFAGLFGLFMVNGVSLTLIWVLLEKFHDLNGWTFWEIVFLYSLYLTCLGLNNLFFRHLISLENYIVDGTFDRFLVRPWNPLFQLLGNGISQSGVSDFLLGLVGISLAYTNLSLNWGFIDWGMLLFYILNGTVLFSVVLLAISSLSFWLIKSRPFLYGTMEIQESVQHYPIDIFGKYFKYLVSSILPYALINYYPTKILLHKVTNIQLPFYVLYTILITMIFLLLSTTLWKRGINRYQSTGS